VIAEQETAREETQAAPYVTIILPCYNEEGHVIAEIERISAAMDAGGWHVGCVGMAQVVEADARQRLML